MSDVSSTVVKAITILETLASSPDPMNIGELAKATRIPRPTIYRFIHTWEDKGYIELQEDGTYRLGTKILKLSRIVLDNIDLRVVAKPILRDLRSQVDETTILSVLEGNHIFYLGNFECTHALRPHSRMGTIDPLHCTSAGKAILAFLPALEQNALVNNLDFSAITPNTITNKNDLLAELAEIKNQGFAFDLEENEIGINEISVPVYNHNRQVEAAISVSGPAFRLDKDRLTEIAPMVIEAANNLSRLLGYIP